MKLNNLTADELRSRYQKVSGAAKYLLGILVVISAGSLFLPPWIINLFSKHQKTQRHASEPSLFQQYGWEAVGIAALVIIVLLVIFLFAFQWFQLRKKINGR